MLGLQDPLASQGHWALKDLKESLALLAIMEYKVNVKMNGPNQKNRRFQIELELQNKSYVSELRKTTKPESPNQHQQKPLAPSSNGQLIVGGGLSWKNIFTHDEGVKSFPCFSRSPGSDWEPRSKGPERKGWSPRCNWPHGAHT